MAVFPNFWIFEKQTLGRSSYTRIYSSISGISMITILNSIFCRFNHVKGLQCHHHLHQHWVLPPWPLPMLEIKAICQLWLLPLLEHSYSLKHMTRDVPPRVLKICLDDRVARSCFVKKIWQDYLSKSHKMLMPYNEILILL